MMSQCRHIRDATSRVTEYATGSAGNSHLGGQTITSPAGDWEYQGPRADPRQREHDDLFVAIRRGDAYNELKYGAYSTMTSILGRMATYSGKVVQWDDAINSQIDLSPRIYDYSADPPVMPRADGSYAVPVPGKTVVI